VSELSFTNKVALNGVVVLNVPLAALLITDEGVLILGRMT